MSGGKKTWFRVFDIGVAVISFVLSLLWNVIVHFSHYNTNRCELSIPSFITNRVINYLKRNVRKDVSFRSDQTDSSSSALIPEVQNDTIKGLIVS